MLSFQRAWMIAIRREEPVGRGLVLLVGSWLFGEECFRGIGVWGVAYHRRLELHRGLLGMP